MISDESLIVASIIGGRRCNTDIAFIIELVVSCKFQEVRHESYDSSSDQTSYQKRFHDLAISFDEIKLSRSKKYGRDGKEDDEDKKSYHTISDGHNPRSDSASVDEYRDEETHDDRRKKHSDKIFERKFFKEGSEFFLLPKISSQESHQSDDDNLFSHPDYLPECSIQSELVGDKRLEKELDQKSDEKYFRYKREHFDHFV